MNDQQNIISRDNQLLKLARAVRDRRQKELLFIEGLRLCQEAIRSNLKIEVALYTKAFAQDKRGKELLQLIDRLSPRMGIISDTLMNSIADAKTPQGIILLAQKPDTSQLQLNQENAPLLVILHGINNPSNAGSIIRTAEAAGTAAIITTKKSTDIFSPKGLRGAMGSSFRIPCWTDATFSEVVQWCKFKHISLVATEMAANVSYREINWTVPIALIVGEEGHGIPSEDLAVANIQIKIPMQPPVESLNVSVASAIILYEASRQREELLK
jgi:RNA methyltransferase, TrmH family